MNKKIILLSLMTCTLHPLPASPATHEKASHKVLPKRSKETEVEKKIRSLKRNKKSLEAQELPRLRGYFIHERVAYLKLMKELHLLQLEGRQTLLEAKNALVRENGYPLRLMRAATYLLHAMTALIYTLCGVSIIWVILK